MRHWCWDDVTCAVAVDVITDVKNKCGKTTIASLLCAVRRGWSLCWKCFTSPPFEREREGKMNLKQNTRGNLHRVEVVSVEWMMRTSQFSGRLWGERQRRRTSGAPRTSVFELQLVRRTKLHQDDVTSPTKVKPPCILQYIMMCSLLLQYVPLPLSLPIYIWIHSLITFWAPSDVQ